jgi:DNA-binding transcriptional ArsR family regulator
MNEDMNIETYDQSNAYIDLAANVFTLLSDPTRIRIILLLHQQKEVSVGDIATKLAKPQTAISQHLAKLRLSKVVLARRSGRTMYYRLTDEHAYNLVTQAIFQGEHIHDQKPTHHHLT